MAELNQKTHKAVIKLCKKGDKLSAKQKYAKAQLYYTRALDLIPEPIWQWSATNWIVVAQMDAAFLNNDIEISRKLLNELTQADENIGNPFFHLRNGQTYFLEGNEDRAVDELIRAYALEGPDMLGEDRKYLEFLATHAEGIDLS